MTAILGTADVERFRAAIARRLGLLFDESKLGHLGEVLARTADSRGVSAANYVDRLESQEPLHRELPALAQELTVGETYFFRHFDQFRASAEVAIPDRLSVRASVRKLSVLSAGCASGEEAYSLAILLRDRLSDYAAAVGGAP
jgi:chemotaxis protein methyltransferase CheR